MKYIPIICISFLLLSCAVEPVPINYGSDSCHFCKMTIVDQQHAAEFVTTKGKVYKFDAIECMLKSIKAFEDDEIAHCLITAYDQPGKLVDAKQAHYLVCDQIPSPMGAYLSGFEDEKVRSWTVDENGGLTYTWEELVKKGTKLSSLQ